MATSVTTETLNGDLCELPPDPGKSPGPWKRSKELKEDGQMVES